jgi:hypothetical protein
MVRFSHKPLPLMGRGWGGVMSPEEAPHFIDVTPTQPSPIEGEGNEVVAA